MKMPPIEKIVEAYTAVVDGRVRVSENQALVNSSDQAKTYTVKWQGNIYSSNDNATYWQGYPGYPILAVLMQQGRLKNNKKVAHFFTHVNWHQLNKDCHRDYPKAVASIIKKRGGNTEKIKFETGKVYEQLKRLPLTIKRNRVKVQKGQPVFNENK